MTAAAPSAPAPLLIVGAGGLGRETLEAVRALNAVHPTWSVAGFLDDDDNLAGTSIGGEPVVGRVEQALRLADHRLVVTTGRPDAFDSRRRIVQRLDLPDSRWASVVHPDASIASSTRLGPGCVVLAGVVATADIAIGAHVAVMPQCVLTHDVVVADFATLASGVRLSGGVLVGEGAYVGAGVLIREGCQVGPGALVGIGAVVLEDIPAGEVWAGVPARRIRDVDQAAEPAGVG